MTKRKKFFIEVTKTDWAVVALFIGGFILAGIFGLPFLLLKTTSVMDQDGLIVLALFGSSAFSLFIIWEIVKNVNLIYRNEKIEVKQEKP